MGKEGLVMSSDTHAISGKGAIIQILIGEALPDSMVVRGWEVRGHTYRNRFNTFVRSYHISTPKPDLARFKYELIFASGLIFVTMAVENPKKIRN